MKNDSYIFLYALAISLSVNAASEPTVGPWLYKFYRTDNPHGHCGADPIQQAISYCYGLCGDASAVLNVWAEPDHSGGVEKEREGNKVAPVADYDDAHDAKKGRDEGGVDICRDKTTDNQWLWNGVEGAGKESL